MPLVRGLDHINIRTADLAATKALFVDVLGLSEGYRPAFGVPGAWLYAGDRAVVHLVEVAAPPPGSEGSSLDHFAFEIDDFDEAVGRLEAAGHDFRVLGAPDGPVRQIFLLDPNGAAIELNYRVRRAG
jgi:catechol 2,3-dioxygenase-like lactoylglutathione lyase family enzyme